jgi:hypothetical protein
MNLYSQQEGPTHQPISAGNNGTVPHVEGGNGFSQASQYHQQQPTQYQSNQPAFNQSAYQQPHG